MCDSKRPAIDLLDVVQKVFAIIGVIAAIIFGVTTIWPETKPIILGDYEKPEIKTVKQSKNYFLMYRRSFDSPARTGAVGRSHSILIADRPTSDDENVFYTGNSHKGLSILHVYITNFSKNAVRIKGIKVDGPRIFKGFKKLGRHNTCRNWMGPLFKIEGVFIKENISVPVIRNKVVQRHKNGKTIFETISLLCCFGVRIVDGGYNVASGKATTVAKFAIAVLQNGSHHTKGTIHISHPNFVKFGEPLSEARTWRYRYRVEVGPVEGGSKMKSICGWFQERKCR